MNRIICVNENNMWHNIPCIFDNGQKATTTIYSDRLYQWDHKKHDKLCKKYFGNEGQNWSNRNPEIIEKFLRDYMDNQFVVLCRIEEDINSSTGYPIWRFDFLYNENN